MFLSGSRTECTDLTTVCRMDRSPYIYSAAPVPIPPTLLGCHVQDAHDSLHTFVLASKLPQSPFNTCSQTYCMASPMQSASAAAGVQDAGPSDIARNTPAPGGNRPSAEDWTRNRVLIKRLYIDEDRTLKDVIATMEREHGYKATWVTLLILMR